MREELNRKDFHEAINTTLSGLQSDPWLYQRVAARLGNGEIKVKRKVSASLIIALIIALIAAVAVAATLLSHKEVVEQVAVPMAIENDTDAGINNSYTAEQMIELIRTLNENGITLEENNKLMQIMRNGQGYWEEETMMEVCRQAFGGNYYTWTLEEQDWFEDMMVQCGFHETHAVRVPGPDNMTYEAAEAFAFSRLRQEYGQDLAAEDRTVYQLSRQFYHDINDGKAAWNFTLDPLDVMHGQYYIQFLDEDPDGTAYVGANIPDWTPPYTGSQLLTQFHSVYSWSEGTWSQAVWQLLHEMMQSAELDPGSYNYTVCTGCQLTGYPEPEQNDMTKDEAIRIGKEALQLDRAALNSAVLTEYEGHREWLVGMIIYQNDSVLKDDEAGEYVIAIDSRTGNVESIRKKTTDDDTFFAFVPQAAYEKAWEGILKNSDYIHLAAEAIQKIYPGLDLMNEEEYTVINTRAQSHDIQFRSKVKTHGNASATVTSDGTVSEATADVAPLNGDNIFQRYSSAYGYFGNWDQETWGILGKDMETLNPTGFEYLPLKNTRYPQESSVKIDHEKAQKLAVIASGKRMAEINTCVLVEAEPHSVWIMRLLTDEPDDPVLGIDAETGEVVFAEQFKTDYTPMYVLYSLPETWRKIELENLGAAYMAKVAITHQYGDMWFDEPELDVDNTDNWECQQEGLTVRYIGRWAGMKSYEVELNENGYILRCEEKESDSITEKSDNMSQNSENDPETVPTPTPRPDGKPWFWENSFEPQEFWDQLEELMDTHGITVENEPAYENGWHETYGHEDFWPQEYKIIEYLFRMTPEMLENQNGSYPAFPREDKKRQEEINEIAMETFRKIAEPEMGKEWVDQLKIGSALINDCTNPDSGEKYGYPVWWVNFEEWEVWESFSIWNPKGYAILDEDGNVLVIKMELLGNG